MPAPSLCSKNNAKHDGFQKRDAIMPHPGIKSFYVAKIFNYILIFWFKSGPFHVRPAYFFHGCVTAFHEFQT